MRRHADGERDSALIFVSGGPAGLAYGFLVVWAGTLSIFLTIAELASLYENPGQLKRRWTFAN